MTRIRNGFLAVALLLLVGAAGSARATLPGSAHEEVTGTVGQPVTLDGEQVHTVVRTERWYGGGYWQPPAGKAAVTLEIQVKALQKTSYNGLYYTVKGPGDATYGRVVIGVREESLGSSNDLAPGETANGWLTFLVPAGQLGGLKLVYHMHAGFGSTLTVPLGAIPDSARSVVGRRATVAGEQGVVVTRIERPATIGIWKPQTGRAYLTAYVQVRALKQTTVRGAFSAFTPAGVWVGKPLVGSRTPSFPYKATLRPGGIAQGWVTFMPTKSQQHGLTLVYHLYDHRDTLLVRLP